MVDLSSYHGEQRDLSALARLNLSPTSPCYVCCVLSEGIRLMWRDQEVCLLHRCLNLLSDTVVVGNKESVCVCGWGVLKYELSAVQ